MALAVTVQARWKRWTGCATSWRRWKRRSSTPSQARASAGAQHRSRWTPATKPGVQSRPLRRLQKNGLQNSEPLPHCPQLQKFCGNEVQLLPGLGALMVQNCPELGALVVTMSVSCFAGQLWSR